MNDEEVKKTGDELLELLEKHLVEYTIDLIKKYGKYELSAKEAETILAKIGKRLLLKIINN